MLSVSRSLSAASVRFLVNFVELSLETIVKVVALTTLTHCILIGVLYVQIYTRKLFIYIYLYIYVCMYVCM